MKSLDRDRRRDVPIITSTDQQIRSEGLAHAINHDERDGSLTRKFRSGVAAAASDLNRIYWSNIYGDDAENMDVAMVDLMMKEKKKKRVLASSGNFSLVCRICSKEFSTGRALGGHMRIHGSTNFHIESELESEPESIPDEEEEEESVEAAEEPYNDDDDDDISEYRMDDSKMKKKKKKKKKIKKQKLADINLQADSKDPKESTATNFYRSNAFIPDAEPLLLVHQKEGLGLEENKGGELFLHDSDDILQNIHTKHHHHNHSMESGRDGRDAKKQQKNLMMMMMLMMKQKERRRRRKRRSSTNNIDEDKESKLMKIDKKNLIQKKKRRKRYYYVSSKGKKNLNFNGSSDADVNSIHRCPVCSRGFMSQKALFGHMRSHPERQWRGIQPPANLNQIHDDHTSKKQTLIRSNHYINQSAKQQILIPSHHHDQYANDHTKNETLIQNHQYDDQYIDHYRTNHHCYDKAHHQQSDVIINGVSSTTNRIFKAIIDHEGEDFCHHELEEKLMHHHQQQQQQQDEEINEEAFGHHHQHVATVEDMKTSGSNLWPTHGKRSKRSSKHSHNTSVVYNYNNRSSYNITDYNNPAIESPSPPQIAELQQQQQNNYVHYHIKTNNSNTDHEMSSTSSTLAETVLTSETMTSNNNILQISNDIEVESDEKMVANSGGNMFADHDTSQKMKPAHEEFLHHGHGHGHEDNSNIGDGDGDGNGNGDVGMKQAVGPVATNMKTETPDHPHDNDDDIDLAGCLLFLANGRINTVRDEGQEKEYHNGNANSDGMDIGVNHSNKQPAMLELSDDDEHRSTTIVNLPNPCAKFNHGSTAANDHSINSLHESSRKEETFNHTNIMNLIQKVDSYDCDMDNIIDENGDQIIEVGNNGHCQRVYMCSGCNKSFGSPQALGGHRASHKKKNGCYAKDQMISILVAGATNKRSSLVTVDQAQQQQHMLHGHGVEITTYTGTANSVDANIARQADPMKQVYTTSFTTREQNIDIHNNNDILGHECSICHRVFPTGQALGGHKRCHWTGDKTPQISSAAHQNNINKHKYRVGNSGHKFTSEQDYNAGHHHMISSPTMLTNTITRREPYYTTPAFNYNNATVNIENAAQYHHRCHHVAWDLNLPAPLDEEDEENKKKIEINVGYYSTLGYNIANNDVDDGDNFTIRSFSPQYSLLPKLLSSPASESLRNSQQINVERFQPSHTSKLTVQLQ